MRLCSESLRFAFRFINRRLSSQYAKKDYQIETRNYERTTSRMGHINASKDIWSCSGVANLWVACLYRSTQQIGQGAESGAAEHLWEGDWCGT